jgi:hypothetical protein
MQSYSTFASSVDVLRREKILMFHLLRGYSNVAEPRLFEAAGCDFRNLIAAN